MKREKKPEQKCACGRFIVPERKDFVMEGLVREHWRHECGPKVKPPRAPAKGEREPGHD